MNFNQEEQEILDYFQVNNINDLTDENWKYVWNYFKLSEYFILKYKNKIDLDIVLDRQLITESFFNKLSVFFDYVDWVRVFRSKKISIDLIPKNIIEAIYKNGHDKEEKDKEEWWKNE